MNVLIVVLTFFLVTGIGYSVIRGFRLLPEMDNFSTLAYGYGLGVGLVAFQLYVYSRLGVVWSKEVLIFPWIGLLVVVFLRGGNYLRNDKLLSIPKLKKIDFIFLIAIFLTAFYVFFEALIRPVMVWDAWAIWLLKSKIFFIDGGILPEALTYVKSDYPLVVSLLGTFVYLVLGQVDDTSVLLTSFGFYIFLALLFFSLLRKRYGTTYALLFTFLFISIQNFVRHGGRIEAGMADLPLGYYMFVCITLLFEYLKNSSGKVLILLTIFLGITGLVKFEGIPFTLLAAICILIHIFKYKLYSHIFLLVFWLTPIVDWEIYKRIHNVGSSYFAAHQLEWSIEKSVASFSGTVKELARIKSWNLLWIVYIYLLVINMIRKNRELALLNLFILFQFGLYMCMYFFTSGNAPESSVQRLLVHIAPLVLYYIAIASNNILTKKLH